MLLAVLRFIQGLGAGGESGVAVVYLHEVSLPRTKGITASLAQAAAGVGVLAATAVVQITRHHYTEGTEEHANTSGVKGFEESYPE